MLAFDIDSTVASQLACAPSPGSRGIRAISAIDKTCQLHINTKCKTFTICVSQICRTRQRLLHLFYRKHHLLRHLCQWRSNDCYNGHLGWPWLLTSTHLCRHRLNFDRWNLWIQWKYVSVYRYRGLEFPWLLSINLVGWLVVLCNEMKIIWLSYMVSMWHGVWSVKLF